MPLKPLLDEPELLLKIAGGDQQAFCNVFDHYRKYVYSFGLKLLRSEEMAEEIVQDIFLKIWEGRSKLRDLDNFGAYLNTLVRNHSFNLLRQLAQRQKKNPEIFSAMPDRNNDTQHIIDYRETVRILEEVLALLPEQQRKVYTLCHLDGLKYEEAAELMNISSATVHYHMKLALHNIRGYLMKNGVSYQLLLFLFFFGI